MNIWSWLLFWILPLLISLTPRNTNCLQREARLWDLDRSLNLSRAREYALLQALYVSSMNGEKSVQSIVGSSQKLPNFRMPYQYMVRPKRSQMKSSLPLSFNYSPVEICKTLKYSEIRGVWIYEVCTTIRKYISKISVAGVKSIPIGNFSGKHIKNPGIYNKYSLLSTMLLCDRVACRFCMCLFNGRPRK